jgi:hypothetical protein
MGLWESLTTGEGTPWGPTKTGQPNMPNMDLGSYKGFDTSPLAAAARQKIGKGAAGAREQSLARLRQAGVKGADTGAALANVAGQQSDALAQMEADMAMKEYQSQQQERDAALKKYELEMMGYAGENQGRAGFWNSLASLGGELGGAYLGRKK